MKSHQRNYDDSLDSDEDNIDLVTTPWIMTHTTTNAWIQECTALSIVPSNNW